MVVYRQGCGTYTAKAVELRMGGVRAPVGFKSLIIPLTMPGQSDKVVIQRKRDRTDEREEVHIGLEDLEEWKTALYIFGDDEKIETLGNPIRFIWVRLTMPWTDILLG